MAAFLAEWNDDRGDDSLSRCCDPASLAALLDRPCCPLSALGSCEPASLAEDLCDALLWRDEAGNVSLREALEETAGGLEVSSIGLLLLSSDEALLEDPKNLAGDRVFANCRSVVVTGWMMRGVLLASDS